MNESLGSDTNAHSTSAPVLSKKALELLDGIHATPTLDYYSRNREAFKSEIERPMKELFARVAVRLDPSILDFMETKRRVLGRFAKNDYGKGGAWEYYWGAFYPKGDKRQSAPQLYISIQHNEFKFGFSLGDYDDIHASRFVSNWKRHSGGPILESLRRLETEDRVYYGLDEGNGLERNDITLNQWSPDPSRSGIHVRQVIPPAELLARDMDSIADRIAAQFHVLYPLVLLSSLEDPHGALESYWKREITLGGASWVKETPSSLVSPAKTQPVYSLEDLSAETYLQQDVLLGWLRALERKRQGIFYGPPGTGKTFVAERVARHMVAGGDGFVELVQFHPSYAYEDFIQGIRPRLGAEGVLTYEMIAGRFMEFGRRAEKSSGTCVLIIDEINRANLSRVFGEMMYLLEYRERSVPLSGGNRLRIPGNVRILGTMNTADRSIALVDHALRRRFAFIQLPPDYNVLRRYHEKHTRFAVDGLIRALQSLNAAIEDPHFEVGVSYFLREDLETQVEDIWRREIEPYIEELFFDRRDRLTEFRWERIAGTVLG